MSSRVCAIVLMWAFVMVGPAEARVFNFQKENLAAFLRATGGMTSLGQDAFVHASGASTNFQSEVQYSFGGEIGAQITFAEKLNLRLGIEAFRPKDLESKGLNAGGTELMTLNSEVFAFSPMLTLEYIYSSLGNVRFYGFVSGAYTTVTLDNGYTLTAAGQAAYPGIPDFTEKSETIVWSGLAGLGFEALFTDNVTFSLDFAYRHMPVRELKHKADNVTFVGNVVKGDVVHNADGSNRQMDLSGVTVGASFRFYLAF